MQAYIPHTTDTINLELILNDNLRQKLNNQNIIKYESQFNCNQLNFIEYETKIMPHTTITKEIIKLLFEQHPIYKDNKEKLWISTFRTTSITDCGLNGESVYHRDNILFPNNCDRNLIITWGVNGVSCGTESLNISDSNKYIKIKEKYGEKRYGIYCDDDFENEELLEDDLLYFNDNIINITSYIKKRNLTIYKSMSPNKNNNITALIMSGKKVLHRREPICKDMIGKYRYVLNVYYNSSDI
jgi:hypothetical protein